MTQSKLINPLTRLSYRTRGYLTLSSAFCQHLILGSFYVWGGILTYVASSLQNDGQSYTKESVAILTPFITFSLNIGTPFGPILTKKIGYQPLMFISSFLMSLCVFISSFVINHFPIFVFLYGVCFGIFSGTLYMAPFNTVYLYFPNNKGIAGGIITAGFALGSTILIWIMYAIINPDNKKASIQIGNTKYYDSNVTDKLPEGIRILSFIQFIFFFISTIFHIRPSQDEISAITGQSTENNIVSGNQNKVIKVNENVKQQQQQQNGVYKNNTEQDQLQNKQEINNNVNIIHYQIHNNNNNNNDQQQQTQKPQEYDTIKECLQTKFIYISIILSCLFTLYGCLIFQNYKILGEKLQYTDKQLNYIGSFSCIINCFSRILWGKLIEKYIIKNVAKINLTIQILSSFTFYWCSGYYPLFFIQIMLAFFTVGGWTSMMVAIIVRVYGKKIGTTIYSVTFVGFSFGSFISFFMLKFISPQIHFQYFVWIYTFFQIIAFVLILNINFNVQYRKKL